jgi:hypothetical protein
MIRHICKLATIIQGQQEEPGYGGVTPIAAHGAAVAVSKTCHSPDTAFLLGIGVVYRDFGLNKNYLCTSTHLVRG